MERQIDLELLDRYFAGTCSPHERHEVDEWIRREPIRSLAAMKDGASSYPATLGDPDAMWTRVHRRTHRVANPAGTSGSAVIGRRFRERIAAKSHRLSMALGLTAAVGLMSWGIMTYSSTASPAMREFSTAIGQRTTLQLPDGSTALLAPETRVRYPASFGKTSRTVEVVGQALFTVTHSAGMPFVVRTAGTDTRVLGTSFAVRRYAEDTVTHVVVAEGKVAVTSHSNPASTILTTGQEVRATALGHTRLQTVQNIGSVLAWTQGRLEFSDLPLQDVVADLKRLYAVDIQIASPRLAQQLVTGAISQSMSVDGAVNTLTVALGIKAERRGTIIYLSE